MLFGGKAVIVDPKSERGNWQETLPDIAHEIKIVNLTSEEQNQGLLDPYVIMQRTKDAESLAIDILTFLTGISSRDGEKFPVLRRAVRTVTQSEQRIVDTNKIENFVKAFAKCYYSWSNSQEAIDARTNKINQYLTKELQDLNTDTVRADIPTSSTATDVKIWDIEQTSENDFTVIYSVDQTVTEGDASTQYTSAYTVVVYVDDNEDMVITQNPTISSVPTKSGYEPTMNDQRTKATQISQFHLVLEKDSNWKIVK